MYDWALSPQSLQLTFPDLVYSTDLMSLCSLLRLPGWSPCISSVVAGEDPDGWVSMGIPEKDRTEFPTWPHRHHK